MEYAGAIKFYDLARTTLAHIADNVHDRWFDPLLRQPKFNRYWEAIVLSAGGNDLIDAAQQRAVNKDGTPAALDARVLLTPAEAALHKPAVAGPPEFDSCARKSLICIASRAKRSTTTGSVGW